MTQALANLHWLLCAQCIQYKILTLVFKSLHGSSLDYLSKLLNKRVNKGRRHDPDDILLVVPFTAHKTFADCAFSVCGPKLWNGLTKHVDHPHP